MRAKDAPPHLKYGPSSTELVAQEVVVECSEAAMALRLHMPLSVSMRVGETASVYKQLVHAARDPQHCIPLTPSLEVQAFWEPKIPPQSFSLLNRRVDHQAAGVRLPPISYMCNLQYTEVPNAGGTRVPALQVPVWGDNT